MRTRLSEMTTLKCNCSVSSTTVLGLLHFTNRTIFIFFNLVIETWQKVGGTRNAQCGIQAARRRKFPQIFCDSIGTQRKVFIFPLKTLRIKLKHSFNLIRKMYIFFARIFTYVGVREFTLQSGKLIYYC